MPPQRPPLTNPQPSTAAQPTPSHPNIETTAHKPYSSPPLQLRYRLSPTSYKLLLTIPPNPDRRTILQTACQAQEFRSFPIRQGERDFFRDINENRPIPYLLREAAVSQPWHKVFLLVQMDLLKTGWPNKLSGQARKELQTERTKIYGVLNQVLRCVVDVLGERLDGRGVSVALDVLRSVKAGVWEGNGMDLTQVENIGLARMEKLVLANVRNIRQLANMEFYHIERILSRNPPFGQNVRRSVKDFPYLQLKIDILNEQTSQPIQDEPTQGKKPWTARIWLAYDNKDLPVWNKTHPWTTLVIEGHDGRLAWFWRGSVKRLKGGKELTVRLEAVKDEEMTVTFACEEIVGTMVRETFKI